LKAYAILSISLVASIFVAVMYADTSRELKVLNDLNAKVPGEFGSAFSNGTQTLSLLVLKFVVDMDTYWTEALSGRLRGYSNNWVHVPFYVGRTLITAVGAANVLPVLLASSAPKQISGPALILLSITNYRSVSLLLDKAWFFLRRTCGRVTKTEKEAHYMMLQLKDFWDKGATVEQKEELLDIIISRMCAKTTFSQELDILTEFAAKIAQFNVRFFLRRLCLKVMEGEGEVKSMMQHLEDFWDKEATENQKQILLEILIPGMFFQKMTFAEESSVLRRFVNKVLDFKKENTPVFDENSYSYQLKKVHEMPFACPSLGEIGQGIVKLLLSGMFVIYCLQQFASIVWGTHKALGWVLGRKPEELTPGDSLADLAFGFGLISMLVALARCFDWAVIQLFPALASVVKDIRETSTREGALIKGFAAFAATGITAISTGGSIEGAVKGMENIIHIQPGAVIGPLLNAIQHGGPFFDYAPAYISGFSMNLTGNIQIAFKAMELVDYYQKLYRLPDDAIEPYLRSLECQAFGELLGALVSNIQDGRHFSEKDLSAIVDAVRQEFGPKGQSLDEIEDPETNNLEIGLLGSAPKSLETVRQQASERASTRWMKAAPGLLFWTLEKRVGGKLLEAAAETSAV
jgi:hypothetical protein